MATIAKLVVELGMDDSDFKNSIQGSASSLDSWGKSLMKTGGIITGFLAAPILAGSKAAWGQVDAVEQATLAMYAYADSTEQVDQVISDLLDYARSPMGVLFSRQELFDAAQSMVMYGASIDDVAGYTEMLSRSVGLGLGDWETLNSVIGRVGSTGRLTGNDFDMLTKMGYQLDDSLRNTNITWEELFYHLDQGIPADALAGQADTIRGKTIRLQSALRNLGMAFLGVDADTSKFIEGGLGDTMFKGMEQLTELMKQAVPAVQQFGSWMADAAGKLSGLVDWFLKLPQPLKTALLLFTGISGVAMMLGGAFLLVSSKIMGFIGVIKAMGGLTGIVKALGAALRAVTLTNPLFWLLAAAVGAFVAYQNNFLGFRDAVNKFASTVRSRLSQAKRAFDSIATVVQYFGRVWKSAFDGFIGSGRDPVSAGFMAVRQAMYQVSTIAGPFGPLLRGIGDAFGAMRFVIADVVASFDSFRSAAANLGDAIGFLLDGEWGKAFTSLKDAATDGLEGILTALDSVLDALGQFGSWMIERLGDIGSQLWTWLTGQLASVDWAGAFQSALNVLSAIGSWIVDRFGSVIGAIGSWFSDQVSGVSWQELATAALSVLSSFGTWVVDTFTSITEAIGTWFSDQFGDVNWVTLATDAVDSLASAIGTAVSSMASIVANIFRWMTDQLNGVSWSSVGEKFGQLLGIALKAAIGLIALAARFFLQLMIELGKVDWATLAAALWGLLKAAALAAIDLITGIAKGLYDTLLADITGMSWDELWETVWSGIDSVVSKWNTLIDAIKTGWNWIQVNIMGQEPSGVTRTPWEPKQTEVMTPDRGMQPALAMGTFDPTFLKFGEAAREAAAGSDLFSKALTNLNAASITSNSSLNATASTMPMYTSATQAADSATGTMATNMGRSFSQASASALSNFSTMQGGVGSRVSAMQANVASRMAGMQATTATQTALMNRTASSNASGMASAVGGHVMGMQTRSAVQMALMSSTSLTQGESMRSNLVSKSSEAATGAASQLARLSGIVSGAGASAAIAALIAGQNIGNSMARGMESALGRVRNAANALVNEAIRAVNAAAMIASPSKLFMQAGEYMGEGMELGILSTLSDVRRASDQLIDTGLQVPSMANAHGGIGGQTIVNNTTQVYVLEEEAWVRAQDGIAKGRAAHATLNNPDSFSQWGGN